jgi:hypothetical protein
MMIFNDFSTLLTKISGLTEFVDLGITQMYYLLK